MTTLQKRIHEEIYKSDDMFTQNTIDQGHQDVRKSAVSASQRQREPNGLRRRRGFLGGSKGRDSDSSPKLDRRTVAVNGRTLRASWSRHLSS